MTLLAYIDKAGSATVFCSRGLTKVLKNLIIFSSYMVPIFCSISSAPTLLLILACL